MSHPTRVRGLKLFALQKAGKGKVAPHAGAWIETPCRRLAEEEARSHPTRVRGLKHVPQKTVVCVRRVAPHAGAWIETLSSLTAAAGSRMSHPTRVRGLKRKALAPRKIRYYLVAPHAGAWIETSDAQSAGRMALVAPHAGAWIETVMIRREFKSPNRRTPRGCVD